MIGWTNWSKRAMGKRNPHINLWPPSMWFSSKHASGVEWKPDMTPEEAAAVIERFIDGPCDSIEWCDFAETRQKDSRIEAYRKRCDRLSPLVNRPGDMDAAAVAELRSIVGDLRSMRNHETLKP
jgi:hypothetical protein